MATKRKNIELKTQTLDRLPKYEPEETALTYQGCKLTQHTNEVTDFQRWCSPSKAKHTTVSCCHQLIKKMYPLHLKCLELSELKPNAPEVI